MISHDWRCSKYRAKKFKKKKNIKRWNKNWIEEDKNS